MKIKTNVTRNYLILLVISIVAISALACNLINLVGQPQNYEPRLGEDEPFFQEEDPYRGENENFQHEDEAFHGEEEEYQHDEPRPEEEEHHEGEPEHEEPPPGEDHHEEGQPEHEDPPPNEDHHEEEPPPGEECPPESECPGGQGGEPEGGPGEEGIRTDLAVTDIFPEILPFGDLKARITNNGPTPLTTYPAELFCHAHGVSWGGPEHGEEDRESHQQVILSLGPGDTDEFETGIKIDANLYQYEVICEVWVDIDPEPQNNFYMEMVPESNQ